MPESKKSKHELGRTVLTGFLTVTSFITFNVENGLASQLVRVTEQKLASVPSENVVKSGQIPISDEQLIKELGANTFVIEEKKAFLINQVQEKKVAPNGFYKFSNGLVITVKDGHVTNQATLKLIKEVATETLDDPDWRDIIDHWAQSVKPDKKITIADAQEGATRFSVRDTLNKIIET